MTWVSRPGLWGSFEMWDCGPVTEMVGWRRWRRTKVTERKGGTPSWARAEMKEKQDGRRPRWRSTKTKSVEPNAEPEELQLMIPADCSDPSGFRPLSWTELALSSGPSRVGERAQMVECQKDQRTTGPSGLDRKSAPSSVSPSKVSWAMLTEPWGPSEGG